MSKTASDNSQMVSELISLRNKIETILKMASNDQVVMERMEEHMPDMSYRKVPCHG
jgi:hypothetical protein